VGGAGVVRQGSIRFRHACGRSIHFSASRFNNSEPLNVTQRILFRFCLAYCGRRGGREPGSLFRDVPHYKSRSSLITMHSEWFYEDLQYLFAKPFYLEEFSYYSGARSPETVHGLSATISYSSSTIFQPSGQTVRRCF
jgi:hypothetical protein